MPEDVTGEILGVNAGVVRKAGQDVTGAAHPQPGSSGVEEQSWAGGSARPGRALVVDPDAELLSQFRVQGNLPVPAALVGADDDMALPGGEGDIGDVQGHGLAHAQPRVDGQQPQDAGLAGSGTA